MLVDVHAHLTDNYFRGKLDEIIKRAEKNKLIYIISNGVNYKDNLEILKLSKKYKIIKAALGLYPLDAIKLKDDEIELTLEHIRKNRNNILAIGEVGLDGNENPEKQKEIFSRIIELANKINKPLIIHSRKAEKECIELLESYNYKKALFHSFSGNFKLIKKIQDNNWMISIPTNVIRSEHFQKIVREFNLNQILTETDSPYLSPYKNKINEPGFIIETIKIIAKIKNLTKNEVEKIIFMNFQKFFRK